MSFPKYPAYKDSGVEWLGGIPTHWKIEPLKRSCNVFPSNVDKKSYEGQEAVHLCNYTDVYYNERIVAGMDFMPATATPEQIEKFSLHASDVIFTKDSESAEDIAIAAYVPADIPKVICGYHLSMIRPGSGANGNFIKRFFDSAPAKAYFFVSANGLTRVGLSQYAMDNVSIPLPPLSEQTQIARFLDHEIARIDALIAEQQRLIELLKEKRQAVISHAVTKGLDPTVPMKDSGVEWLGEVPAHWKVTKLGWVLNELTYGFTNPMPTEDCGPAMLTANDIGWGVALYEQARSTSKAAFNQLLTDKSRPKAGDLLLTKDGTLGRVAVHDGRPACINQSVALIRPDARILNSEFLCSLLHASCYQDKMIFDAGGTTIKHIYITILAKMNLAIPSLSEQRDLLVFMNEKTDRFHRLVSEAEKGVALLQERRSALISAAVTGKIDVRGWQPPASAPSPELENEAV